MRLNAPRPAKAGGGGGGHGEEREDVVEGPEVEEGDIALDVVEVQWGYPGLAEANPGPLG